MKQNMKDNYLNNSNQIKPSFKSRIKRNNSVEFSKNVNKLNCGKVVDFNTNINEKEGNIYYGKFVSRNNANNSNKQKEEKPNERPLFKNKYTYYNKNKINKNESNKKDRDSSIIINGKNKTQKYFYKLICNNCYNQKLITDNFQEKIEPKARLNKEFTKLNPFYFQDKMNELHQKKLHNKLKTLESVQQKALDNLAKYKIENTSSIEKLQKQNEFSINPLISYQKEDHRFINAQINFDKNEKFINQNKDLYKIGQPRKEIDDYYKKCQYQVPVLEPEYQVPIESEKELKEQLIKQIEDKENDIKKSKYEELQIQKMVDKKIIDSNERIKKRNLEYKRKSIEDNYKGNLQLENYKKEKAEKEKKENKIMEIQLNKRMQKEDNENKVIEKKRKMYNLNKLINCYGSYQTEKNKKKREELEEKKKWSNYEKKFTYKCIHGLDIYRCAICNRIYPKDKLIKYYY